MLKQPSCVRRPSVEKRTQQRQRWNHGALRVLWLAPARFHAWRSLADNCAVDDRPSCPRSIPTQLTAKEISTIGDMVQDFSFRTCPPAP